MAFEFVLLALTVLSTMVYCQSPITSSKRGLVYVPSDKYPQDDAIWDSPSSDLSWYYNYASKPSASFAHFPKLQFVPMLWGAGNSTTFLSDVQSQINAGANITHVLGFNEPDGNSSKYVFSDRFLLWTELRSQGMSWEPKTSSKSRDLSPELNVLINEEMLILKILVSGGSSIPAETAARIWMQQIEPLAKQGVKLGAPACTDFIPVHWYGDFQGLASHIGEFVGTFNKPLWVTEFANANVNLQDSQTFYNQSSSYLDRIENVTHYSYFGAFRSDVSNIGPNAAMLTQDGKLTNIGSWYLGEGETGNVPKGAANRKTTFLGSGLLVLAATWCAL